MSAGTRKLTYQDYVCFPDDGKQHEIIDGDHYMSPAPGTYHQAVSRRLQFQLYTQIERCGLGSVINAPVDVQLSEHDVVQPDLVVVLTGNRIITPTKVKGVPEHLIEIVSPSTEQNDRVLKFSVYERAGVPEYWIVDPREHVLSRYVWTGGKYQQWPHEECVPVSYLSDIAVDLRDVW